VANAVRRSGGTQAGKRRRRRPEAGGMEGGREAGGGRRGQARGQRTESAVFSKTLVHMRSRAVVHKDADPLICRVQPARGRF